MKYSDDFISYFGYRVLWWNALCESDYEKSFVYIDEMFKALDKMNAAELIEVVNQSDIMDAVYRNRNR